MATASTSGQSRKKKSPGLLDQIGTFFGGEKKKARSKGSFRGHLSTAPPRPAASARRHGADNAVMQFLRSFVSTPQPKSRASSPRPEGARSPLRRRRDQNTLSRIFNLGETKARSPPKRWSTIF
ncbi:myelin basic protein-like isoform X4 [Hypomesus transpacificus]|uniref:myelin basic protein-like isoform X4 n=1 Tax=Hypomesus transpacificus TaxID=137520 RepID=UPI001F080597|nr:myelin basic protein-like isoform X4 [Hypomesus transpacificus]